MSDEASAIARLQELALKAAQAMGPNGSSCVMLVSTRQYIPKGQRFQLIPNIKSPRGEFLSVKENGHRFDCLGRFDATEVLAFCMAKLDELGAPCPVTVLGPDGVAFDSQAHRSKQDNGTGAK